MIDRLAALLDEMEHHDPMMYRELLIRGRPGRWRVELSESGKGGCIANPMAPSLEEALCLALNTDCTVRRLTLAGLLPKSRQP